VTDTRTDAYAVETFEAFWPHYARLHRRRVTHLLHAIATASAGLLVTGGIATGRPVLVVLAPLVDYAIAQASHRLFERNRTLPWRNNVWHARAELRMFRLTVTGRMVREVARAESLDADTASTLR